jgi:hypothetical protein
MFPSKILARVFGPPSQIDSKSIRYDEVFKGEASAPAENKMGANWLPGLRPVECDIDIYFTEVFGGQVF